MYKVIESFADLQDYNYLYSVGDTYPRRGMLPTHKRIEELASNKNRLRTPLIEKVSDPSPVKKKAVEPVEEAKAEDKAVELAEMEDRAESVPRKRKKKVE